MATQFQEMHEDEAGVWAKEPDPLHMLLDDDDFKKVIMKLIPHCH